MEKMADRVPGMNQKESRTVSATNTISDWGRHIANPNWADFEHAANSANRLTELIRRQYDSDHWLWVTP